MAKYFLTGICAHIYYDTYISVFLSRPGSHKPRSHASVATLKSLPFSPAIFFETTIALCVIDMYYNYACDYNTVVMPKHFQYALVQWPNLPSQVIGHRDEVVIVHERGRVISASAPLKEWQDGMPLARARNIYVHATFIQRDRVREEAAHAALAHFLNRFSLRMISTQPGSFLLQDPNIDGLARFVARHRALRAAAASCTDWAHLAAYIASPATLRLVYDGKAFLAETPVSALTCGLLEERGEEVAERLQLFGLNNLDMVRRKLTRRHLCAQFGAGIGTLLNNILRPGRQPLLPIHLPEREVHVTHELEAPTLAVKPWVRTIIACLADCLARKLQGVAALMLVLEAFVPNQGAVRSCYMASRGLFLASDLRRLACNLYEDLCLRLTMREILSLRFAAGCLVQRAYVQQQLFTPRTEEPALRRAVRLLQKRYGEHTLLRAERKDSLFLEDRLVLKPLD